VGQFAKNQDGTLSTAGFSQNALDDLSFEPVPTDMPWRSRIELGGFIDLVMAPGILQPQVIRDETDRRCLISELDDPVIRRSL
jgi:hypothetical protein